MASITCEFFDSLATEQPRAGREPRDRSCPIPTALGPLGWATALLLCSMTECVYGGDPLLHMSGRSSRASTVPITGSIGGSPVPPRCRMAYGSSRAIAPHPARAVARSRRVRAIQQSVRRGGTIAGRPIQKRRGYRRGWLLRHASNSELRLQVSADRAASKHLSVSRNRGQSRASGWSVTSGAGQLRRASRVWPGAGQIVACAAAQSAADALLDDRRRSFAGSRRDEKRATAARGHVRRSTRNVRHSSRPRCHATRYQRWPRLTSACGSGGRRVAVSSRLR
jgi:hypothetical protein